MGDILDSLQKVVCFLLDFILNMVYFFGKYAGNIIGAFFGFGFALFVNGLVGRANTRKSINNVKIELIDIRNGLEKQKDNNTLPPCYAYGISLPIWETIKQNGNILAFKKMNCYNHLIGVYAKLEQLIQLENWLYGNSHQLEDEENKKRIETIISLRNVIYNDLTGESVLAVLLRK
jgi:hypothetical protein